MIILENTRDCRGHERLAQTNHIANHHPATLVEVVGGDFDGGNLEFEQLVAEVAGDSKLGETGPGLLGQVIGHLDVDVIRRNRLWTCPTAIDDLDKFFGDVDTEPVVPAVIKPHGQLVAGIVVEYIDVELSLLRKPGQREVAAAQVAYLGVKRIFAEEQIQFGVELMAQKKFYHELSGSDLFSQSAKACFIFISGKTDHELVAEVLGEPSLQQYCRCLVYLVFDLQ